MILFIKCTKNECVPDCRKCKKTIANDDILSSVSLMV